MAPIDNRRVETDLTIDNRRADTALAIKQHIAAGGWDKLELRVGVVGLEPTTL